ncbi:ThuA domain-containing protein [Hirschia maritima]|uniref:ThuA domain-containing protein n=1 Tax=Hirschia maritima TaxID=1121961 RepID=UPI0003785CA5|nr:ThuA domain-containing protein [Hirschia maritima]
MRHALLGVFGLALSACTVLNGTSQQSELEQPPHIVEWMKQPAILVFSETQDWRHNEGIAGADLFFADYTLANEMGLFTTVNSAVFNDQDLARFDLVVFNNMSGDALTSEQEVAFQKWMAAGGDWIGIHGAGDMSHTDWPWYDDTLIGPEFIGHPSTPQFQDATLVNLAKTHPVMEGIPDRWVANDEWYSFQRAILPNEGKTTLVGIDEKSYEPGVAVHWGGESLSMSDDPAKHPLVWVSCPFENSKAFYSALGHTHEPYENETYRRLLTNAIQWTMSDDTC